MRLPMVSQMPGRLLVQRISYRMADESTTPSPSLAAQGSEVKFFATGTAETRWQRFFCDGRSAMWLAPLVFYRQTGISFQMEVANRTGQTQQTPQLACPYFSPINSISQVAIKVAFYALESITEYC